MNNKRLVSIVFYSIFFFCFVTAAAQPAIVRKPGFTVGGQFIYAMPQGQFAERIRYGFGGEVFGGVGWGSTYVIFTTGITRYQNKPLLSDAVTAVPLKIGFKKYFLLKKIFINGDMGSTSMKMKGSGASGFTAGIGGGVKLLGVEASLYYNAVKNVLPEFPKGYSNSLNARIGWGFTL